MDYISVSRIKKLILTFSLIVYIFVGLFSLVMLKHFFYVSQHTKSLVNNTEIFQKPYGTGGQILILGDSLAYGVGTSSPEKSFAGLISDRYPDYKIINNSEIGIKLDNFHEKVKQEVIDSSYDQIYLIIGGNDLLRYQTDLNSSIESLELTINFLANKSDHIFLITPADFDQVSAVPDFIDKFFSERSVKLHNASKLISEQYNQVTYINVFDIDYAQLDYQADDGFHLNDKGIKALVSQIPYIK